MLRRRKEKVELPPEAGEISEALPKLSPTAPAREQATAAPQTSAASGAARTANPAEKAEGEASNSDAQGGLRASLKRAAKEALVRRTSTMR